MATICPNCLRPVRPDAKYCGYCGSSLNPDAHDATSVAQSSPSSAAAIMETSPSQAKPQPKKRGIRRTILIIIILLLCLVLLLAFFMHYLTVIGAWGLSAAYIKDAIPRFLP